jgi:hypothetical protein
MSKLPRRTSRADELLGSTPQDTFQRLIYPHTADRFFSDVWEKAHLHISRDQNPGLQQLFAALISINDLDQLLSTVYSGPRPLNSIRMGQDGLMLPPDEFSLKRDSSFSQIDLDKVLSLYRNGASIIINSLHDSFGPIAELCSDLSRFFGVSIHANAYVTPPKSQGFPLHFDTHDVLFLQISGEKSWTLYESAVPLATPAMQEKDSQPAGPAAQVCLRAGELLYMPRGLLHEGIASDTMSFHVTIGIHVYTWSQLIGDVVAELEHVDINIRRSVAPQLALANKDHGHIGEIVASLTGRLLDIECIRRAATRKAEAVRQQTRPNFRVCGRLEEIVRSHEISLKTIVQRRNRTDTQIQRSESGIILQFDRKSLTLPRFTEPHLRVLCSGLPICAADLPSDLDDDGKIILIRRLVEEGLLSVLEV